MAATKQRLVLEAKFKHKNVRHVSRLLESAINLLSPISMLTLVPSFNFFLLYIRVAHVEEVKRVHLPQLYIELTCVIIFRSRSVSFILNF